MCKQANISCIIIKVKVNKKGYYSQSKGGNDADSDVGWDS